MSIAESNVNHPSVADAMQSCEKNSSSKGDSAHSMRFLPDGFEPGEHDVLCGRGRKCFNHPGNVKFREIVQSFLAQYSKAMTKLEKSYILSDVVEKVRKNSGIGGFIKKNEDGSWRREPFRPFVSCSYSAVAPSLLSRKSPWAAHSPSAMSSAGRCWRPRCGPSALI